MNWKDLFYWILVFFYHIVVPGVYLTLCLEYWDMINSCDRRISICIFIIGLLGIHRCCFLNRFIFKYKGIELETTITLSVIAVYNQRSESCSEPRIYDSIFIINASQWIFDGVLWLNIILLGFTIVLWIVAQIFSFISLIQSNPRIHNQQENGLTDEEIDQLNIIMFQNHNNNINSKGKTQLNSQSEQVLFNNEEIIQNIENSQSQSQISQIDMNKNKKIEINLDEKQGCSICLADFEDGEQCLQLPCKHLYHKECVKQWLKKRIICPNCRNDIRESLMYQQFINNQSQHPVQLSDKILEKINQNLEPSLGSDEYPDLPLNQMQNNFNILNNPIQPQQQ